MAETSADATTTTTERTDPEKSSSSNSRKRKEPEKSSGMAGPITAEGERPQKKFYRQRAHCNPLSHNDAFEYPRRPSEMDWTKDYFPNLPPGLPAHPTCIDVGCGFGGLTMALATLLPQEVVLGMEIRAKVTEYVRLRIVAAREEAKKKDSVAYQNTSVLRTNSQKFLPNYFAKASLRKLFFCFPDPHFKRKNHPRRIISERLLSEYAYLLQPTTGLLYCITDVKELHEWHVQKCDAHPLFERLDDAQTEADPCVAAMRVETEEGQKVERNGGSKYYAVYRRTADQPPNSIHAGNFFATASGTNNNGSN